MKQSNLIPVPFDGTTLYVTTYNDEPHAPMKPIVEGMGLDWSAQARKLRSNKDRWGVVIMTIPSNSAEQQSLCIPLRKLAGWLMTLQATRVTPELKTKVIAYQNQCDDVLWRYWSNSRQPGPTVLALPPPPQIDKDTELAIKQRAKVLADSFYPLYCLQLRHAIKNNQLAPAHIASWLPTGEPREAAAPVGIPLKGAPGSRWIWSYSDTGYCAPRELGPHERLMDGKDIWDLTDALQKFRMKHEMPIAVAWERREEAIMRRQAGDLS